MATREFKMSIDIIVTAPRDGLHVATLVSDAMQELVNRRDFRAGTIKPGRVLQHYVMHDDARVTVDLSTQRVEE